MPLSVIFPSGYRAEVSKLRQHLDEAHLAYWTIWKDQQPEFKIENIRFKHDPGWRRRAFSIQSAHDGGHWIWKATRVIWFSVGGAI